MGGDLSAHTSGVDSLWFVLFAGVAIAFAGGRYYLKHQRKQELASFAQRHRFVYTPHAPPGLLAYSFPLFYRGDGRGADNGIAGTWKDMPFKAADFWYYEETARDAQGRQGGRTYRHFSVAAIDIPAWLPDVTIARENLMTVLANRLGMSDIDFESEEFNRSFQVRAEDRKFAFELIDPRMMQWLLSCDRRLGFELHGRGILVYSKRLAAKDLIVMIGSLEEFRDRIPRLVWNTYAYEPPAEAR